MDYTVKGEKFKSNSYQMSKKLFMKPTTERWLVPLVWTNSKSETFLFDKLEIKIGSF